MKTFKNDELIVLRNENDYMAWLSTYYSLDIFSAEDIAETVYQDRPDCYPCIICSRYGPNDCFGEILLYITHVEIENWYKLLNSVK